MYNRIKEFCDNLVLYNGDIMGYSNGIIIYKNIIILYIYGERRNSDGIKCFCNDLIG